LMLFSGILLAAVLIGPMPVKISAASTEGPTPTQEPTSTPTPTLIPTAIPLPTLQPTHTPPAAVSATSSSQEQQVADLINAYRQQRGLSALTVNPALTQSAHAKAADMIKRNYWSHVSPDGVADWDFFKGAGYTFTLAGENLADNYFTASEVLNAWKASGPHNENLLKPVFTELGIAFVCNVQFHGYSSTCLTVLHLGSRS
jgi:uncharacterized protein YkwD